MGTNDTISNVNLPPNLLARAVVLASADTKRTTCTGSRSRNSK
jgi:hypothetical protein